MSAAVRVKIDPELLDRTLDCYLPSVRYLRSAEVEFEPNGGTVDTEIGPCIAVARGRFQSRPPWYIQETGHFNAIEFNICYNQLAFALLAQCVESNAIRQLSARLPAQEFRARMLADVVITRYSVSFERPMADSEFRATLGVQRVLSKMQRLFLQTQCSVAPPQGDWCARGEVMLAVLNSGAGATRFVPRSPEFGMDAGGVPVSASER